MKRFVVIGWVLSGAMACSSANNEEIQDVLAADEVSESEKTAEESEGAKEMRHDEMTLTENQTAELRVDKEEAEEAKEAEKLAEVKETEVKSQKVYPTASLVNLRQGPGMSHGIARVAAFGEAIELSGETTTLWLQTTEGLWISKLYVDENKPTQPNDPAVQHEQPAVMDNEPTSEVSSEISTAQLERLEEADLD